MQGIFICNPGVFDRVFGGETLAAIQELITIDPQPVSHAAVREDLSQLADIDVILSTWGGPRLDDELLDQAPKLKAVLYAAGSLRALLTDDFWPRNIPICSANEANGVPVSEMTLAQIILALKRYWPHTRDMHANRAKSQQPVAGAYGSTVGLVSLGAIGRRVAKLLQILEVNVIAFDPFTRPDAAAELGVELCSLEDVFTRSDVVSIHTPNLAETRGMITGELVRSMKPGATLINTARGAVVDEPAMIDVLQDRPDLVALLDVTFPEPPETDSPLWTLPNVWLTPHVAGSLDLECRRMGMMMADELRRLINGEPLLHSISRERAEVMA